MKCLPVLLACLLLAPLLSASGCSRTDGKDNTPSIDDQTADMPLPTGRGTIRGKVFYAGPHPQLSMIDTSTDPTCRHGAPLQDESIVVNPNGTLKNVFIYLKQTPREPLGDSAAISATAPAATAPIPQPLLNQIGGQYVPHAIGLRIDQPLILESNDSTLHNVLGQPRVNPAFNRQFRGPGTQEITFHRSEIFHVRCDVHPWMSAWIGVFNHPYFAVTGDDGAFTLSRVPNGHYTLVAWQERFGSLETPISVEPNGTVTSDFKFEPPSH